MNGSRPTPLRLVAAALVASLTLALAACGNGEQAHPVKLDKDKVPFGLLQGPTSTITTTTVPLTKFPFVVYFEGRDGIVPAIRITDTAPDPTTVLEALAKGPSTEEAEVRMRTALPKLALGRVGKVVNHTVTVDLMAPFTQVIGTEQAIALAQIVLTLTLLRGVNKVRFTLDGEPVSVPRGNGTLTRGPVTRADYSATRSG
jgi:spore germination protein GerM